MEQGYEPKVLVHYKFREMKDYWETRKKIENLSNFCPDEGDRKEVRHLKGVKSKKGIFLTIDVKTVSISGRSYKEIDTFRKEIIDKNASVIEEKIPLNKSRLEKKLENLPEFGNLIY